MKQLHEVFTEQHLEMLRRKAAIKRELDKLDAELKPVIKLAVNQCGDGEHEAFGTLFKLKKTTRVSPKWKGISEHYLSEDQISAVLDQYASVSTSHSITEIAVS